MALLYGWLRGFDVWVERFANRPWAEDAFDIDRDGDADWFDLALIGDYLYGSKANPHGIGQPMRPTQITASLSPDPTAVEFKSDEAWHRFTLSVSPPEAQIQVVVNATEGTDLALEASYETNAPTRSLCPGEREDTRSGRRDGDVVWFAGCREGRTNILLTDADDNLLAQYNVTVERDIETSFDIEIVYLGPNSFTSTQKSFIRRAADRWENLITEGLPDTDVEFDSSVFTWWSNWSPHPVYIDEQIDDLRIYVREDPAGFAWGGPLWVRLAGRLPIFGMIGLHPDVFSYTEHTAVAIVTHEIGHCLGFSGWTWEDFGLLGNPSEGGDPDADTYFSGRLAVAAFNYAGGWRYEGRKVPVENGGDDSHWRWSVFGRELMTPYPTLLTDNPLSDITLQSLADLGYKVDLSLADPYTVPPAAKPVAVGRDPGPRCGAGHLPPPGVQH